MSKKMAPLDIMNVLGKAAHNKSRAMDKPDDDEDPLNSSMPTAKSSKADPMAMKTPNAKKAAAIAISEQKQGTKYKK